MKYHLFIEPFIALAIILLLVGVVILLSYLIKEEKAADNILKSLERLKNTADALSDQVGDAVEKYEDEEEAHTKKLQEKKLKKYTDKDSSNPL